MKDEAWDEVWDKIWDGVDEEFNPLHSIDDILEGKIAEGVCKLAKVCNAAGKLTEAAKKLLKKKKCCFVAGTQVLTQTGYKNIEDVKLGEKLWAKNVETGEQDWKEVTRIFVEPDRGIYTIRLLGVDGFIQKIEATDDHPFYVIGKGWKSTIELVAGDHIETDGSGAMSVIEVIDQNRTDLTYNFTVDEFHTYYVTERNVLVHNCDDNHFEGTDKPWTDGATPNSKYSHLDENGNVKQNAIYDENGDVVGHVDFQNHGNGAPSGHGHQFPEPGNPGSGHGPGKPHIPNSDLSSGWDNMPPGRNPRTPIGE